MRNSNVSLFEGKYRISSTRLPGWDYRKNAYYFVTICTKNRFHAFGFVEDGKMILNELGTFTDQSIDGIDQNKENVMIINRIVMPNHVHILLRLNNASSKTKTTNTFGPLISGSLSSLINHFKGRVTKFAQEKSLSWPGWQDRFDDRIVKDENSLVKINQYITNNPTVWHKDRYYQR
jgi:putative transposase